MCPHRSRSLLAHAWPALALLGLCAGASGVDDACAQAVRPAAVERSGPTSAEKRAALQKILEQNAPVLEAQAAVIKAVAKLIGPTVVHIKADVPQQSLYHNRDRKVEEEGSGVIIERGSRFYVLTNRHVLSNAAADAVQIHLADGRQLHPLRILFDADTDVAVLAIEAPDLIAAPLGNSDKLEIGDFVLAAGSPFGLSHSVTFGIISAKGRRDLQLGDATLRLQDFLQTDAAINPGNSGGPLCNLRGEIVGINTAIASNSGGNEGIGFSIPINMFMTIARQLIDSGKVTRGYLGVALDPKFGPAMAAEIGLPSPMGARITTITAGSPAELAHLQVGDVILQVDGTRIEDDSHVVSFISLLEIGRKVPIMVFRDGKTLTLTVEVTDRAKFEQ